MKDPDVYECLAGAADSDAHAADRVTEFLAGAPSVILYGAGNLGREVRRVLIARGWNVRCFLDQAASPGACLDGIDVHAPDDAIFDEATRRDTPVVITIFNPDVDVAALRAQLQASGWRKLMPFVAFHRGFAADLGRRFWLTDLSFYRGHAARMRSAEGLWSDDRSRELFRAVWQYRLTADPAVLPAPGLLDQYIPTDLPAWPTPCRFVDCGAFDGDTLATLRAAGLPLTAVAAFEPDPENIRKLSAHLNALANTSEGLQTLLWPCAVFSTTRRLRFELGRGAASGLSAAGSETVQAVALDEALAGFGPTLIKMDIEGAEHDALCGARGIIARHRPGLAICVYHQPQDLWQIPLLIHQWDLGYRFYLRAHRFNGFDLVLYALREGAVPGSLPS